MEQRLIQIALTVMMALMAWNFKTLNDMQLQMETVMYKYANQSDISDIKLQLEKMKWRLDGDAAAK